MDRPKALLTLLVSVGAVLMASQARAGEASSPEPDPVRQAIEQGRFTEARRMLESATSGADAGERLELLTQVSTAMGDPEAGVRYGKKAVAASPESSNAHYQYAVAVRTRMQGVSQVRAMFSIGAYKKALLRARELDPGNLDAREEEIGFLANAPGIAGGDIDRARALATDLKTMDPGRGTLMEIEVETSGGDPVRATALYREALAGIHAGNERLRLALGFHLQRQERYREADAEFARLKESEDPVVVAGALYQRARGRILGRYELDQAIALLEQFLDRVAADTPGLPSRSNAYWRIGNAHEQVERFGEARAAYTRALELDQENDDARKALKALPR